MILGPLSSFFKKGFYISLSLQDLFIQIEIDGTGLKNTIRKLPVLESGLQNMLYLHVHSQP
jgi:hypothetical protein